MQRTLARWHVAMQRCHVKAALILFSASCISGHHNKHNATVKIIDKFRSIHGIHCFNLVSLCSIVCILFYLSLFSWTGNRPPIMTSPLILAPLGARQWTDTRCLTITFLLLENHETFPVKWPDYLAFKSVLIVLHIFLKKCISTRQRFCSSDLFFSYFKCWQERSFPEIKNLYGTFCPLSSQPPRNSFWWFTLALSQSPVMNVHSESYKQ